MTVTFYATNGKVSRGVVLGREGVMLEVAWDDSEIHPASIGWVNPTEQVGKMVLGVESFTTRHKAIKCIIEGNVKEGKDTLIQEERQRQIERTKTA